MQPRRRHLFPVAGDTVAAIAARELPAEPDAAQLLLSWNLHLTLRRTPVAVDGALLGSDIVYLEPPLP